MRITFNTMLPNQPRYNYTAINRTPNFKSAADVLIKSNAAKNVLPEIVNAEKLTGIFSKNLTELPKGLNITLSQVNSSLLCYSKDIGNGVTVKAIKKFAVEKGKKYLYVLFKEFQDGILQDSFAADMKTGELIRLNREGKLRIVDDDILLYKPDLNNPVYAKYIEKIEKYTKSIFGNEAPEPKVCVDINKETQVDLPKNWPVAKSHYDELSPSTQEDLKFINAKLLDLSNLIRARRGLSKKIIQLKSDYEPIIYLGPKQKNTLFKYRNLESLSVLHIKSNQRFTRIIHTNSNGVETHLLVDENSKVVSNLNKKRPWITPEKYRYMTKKEIEMSGIENYITFLKEKIGDYYDYMNENIGGITVTHRISKKNSAEFVNSFMDDISKKIKKDLTLIQGEIEKRANEDANEMASEYFKILASGFQRYADDGLRNFMNHFEKHMEKFINSSKN